MCPACILPLVQPPDSDGFCWLAGHLYAANDYTAATELTRQLVLNEAARKAMGAAARAHVEKLGWMAAIRRIRDHQYQRAIRTFRAHKR